MTDAAPSYVNLMVGPVVPVVAESLGPGGKVDVPLSAEIANNGSLAYKDAITVTFYADSGLTQIIEEVPMAAPSANEPGLRGCAGNTIAVSATWAGLSSGLHRFWVKVDGRGPEGPGQGSELDNVVKSFVLVNPERSLFPVARR